MHLRGDWPIWQCVEKMLVGKPYIKFGEISHMEKKCIVIDHKISTKGIKVFYKWWDLIQHGDDEVMIFHGCTFTRGDQVPK